MRRGVYGDAYDGYFQGDGTTCAEVNCGQPIGACCLNPLYYKGDCLDGVTESACGTYYIDSEFQGDGTTCADVKCSVP